MDHILKQAFDNLRMHNETTALRAKVERLEAEVDNLRKNADISPSQSPHEIERLKAEVERLRKAGDALAILQCGDSDEQHKRRCVKNWLDVKEGKPSA